MLGKTIATAGDRNQVEAAPEDVFDPGVGLVAEVHRPDTRRVGALDGESLQVRDDRLDLPQPPRNGNPAGEDR